MNLEWYDKGYRAGRFDASMGTHFEMFPYSTPFDDERHLGWCKGYNDGQRDYRKEQEIRHATD